MPAKTQKNNKEEIFLSSRVRLARNISDLPFPEWASLDDQIKAKQITKRAIKKLSRSFVCRELSKTSQLNKDLLQEKNILSKHFVSGDQSTKAFAYDAEGTSLMINEEDHLRLSTQKPDLSLEECWRRIDEIDTELSDQIEFAFSNEIGFTTACPSNTGTGLRASILMHLPALCLERKISPLISMLAESQITVRGLFGEGSMAFGYLFQISNHVSLGISEDETIKYLKRVAQTIYKKEKMSRQNILKKDKEDLEDKINRAIGILRYATILTYEEALEHLSIIKLGQSLDIEKQVKPLKDLAQLSKELRNGHLQNESNIKDPEKLDSYRAKKVKKIVS